MTFVLRSLPPRPFSVTSKMATRSAMQAPSSRTTCPRCQQLLVADANKAPPKVLPGCLHVFCLPCLNTLPLAFVTDSSTSTGGKSDDDQSEGPCSGSEAEGFCPERCYKGRQLSVDDSILFSCESRKGGMEEPVGNAGRNRSFSVVGVQESGSCYNPCGSDDCRTPPLSHGESKQSSETDTGLIPDLALTVSCPRCNRTSLLPSQGFEGLRTSYVVSNLASTCQDIQALQSKLPERKCEQCVEDSADFASSYCCTCRRLICEDHTKCHKLWREFATHRLVPVESLSPNSEGDLDPATIKLLTRSLDLGEVRCSIHSQRADNQHKFFCCTCEDLACLYCTTSAHKDGKGHCCVSITPEVVSEKRETVEESLKQLDSLAEDLGALAGKVKSQLENIEKKASEVKDRIDAVFTEVIDTLRSRQLSLCDEVDSQISSSMKKLEDCTARVNSFKQHVLESRDFVQDNLKSEGDLGLLSVAGVISNHSFNLRKEYTELLPDCKVPVPDIEFVADRDYLYNTIAVFGNVLSHQSSSYGQSRARTRTGTVVSLYERLQKIRNLMLTHTLRDIALVESTPDMFNANLMDSLTGSYVYSPPNLASGGSNGAGIGTPPVVIEIPKISGIFVRSVESLDRPSGIRVDRDFRSVVCDFGTHQVVTLDPGGRIMSRLGREGDKHGQFLFPQCTACDNAGKMLVVDSMYRLQMFDRNGKFVRSVGTKGKGRLQFMDPVSIAISQDKQVFICERENHRIQVLDKEFSFKGFLGTAGRKECEFYLPSDIAISDGGHLFVADSGNHRIQVLSLDGNFVRSFGSKGSAAGELYLPSHVCVDSYGVYVTEEGNHRVSVFTQNGIFIRTIGQKGSSLGQFLRPLGVAIDENKSLYVCDSRNNRIQIFK